MFVAIRRIDGEETAPCIVGLTWTAKEAHELICKDIENVKTDYDLGECTTLSITEHTAMFEYEDGEFAVDYSITEIQPNELVEIVL